MVYVNTKETLSIGELWIVSAKFNFVLILI